MEFNNCEEYVLAELESAQKEVFALKEELERLEAENQLLRERIEAEPNPVERIIASAGRAELFNRYAFTRESVKDGDGFVPFKDWCMGCVRAYSLPKGLHKSEFLEAFEPEFLAAYNERIAEEAEE